MVGCDYTCFKNPDDIQDARKEVLNQIKDEAKRK